MIYGFNTYGLRSINAYTFNGAHKKHISQRPFQGCKSKEDGYISTEECTYEIWKIPARVHNYVNALLRINNLIFNVLGYFPRTKEISGLIRMGIGCSIFVVTLVIGTPTAGPGPITGRWYGEALLTGIAQVFRGSMEASTCYGNIGNVINWCLDVFATLSNINADGLSALSTLSENSYDHPDPDYWLPFQFLRLV